MGCQIKLNTYMYKYSKTEDRARSVKIRAAPAPDSIKFWPKLWDQEPGVATKKALTQKRIEENRVKKDKKKCGRCKI